MSTNGKYAITNAHSNVLTFTVLFNEGKNVNSDIPCPTDKNST